MRGARAVVARALEAGALGLSLCGRMDCRLPHRGAADIRHRHLPVNRVRCNRKAR